jgi:streptogramin lyase
VAVAAVVGGLAVVAAAVALGVGKDDSHGSRHARPTATPTPFAPRVDRQVHLGGRPNRIVAGDRTIFVTKARGDRVSLIDANKGKRRRGPFVGLGSADVATTPRTVWVAVREHPALYALDPRTGRKRSRIALPGQPRAVAVGHGSIWVGMEATPTTTGDVLLKLDPRDGGIVDSYPVLRGIVALASTPAGVWILHRLGPAASRFDPRSERFTRRVQIGVTPVGTADYGAGALWVTSPQEDTLSKIDDKTGAKVAIGVGRRPTAVAARGSQVWVTSLIDHTIRRIDPATTRPAGNPVPVPLNPYALALTRDSVWVASIGRGTIARVPYKPPR